MVNDFSSDAYIIIRNDVRKAFVGIGGNVLPGSSGLRAVARFENSDSSGYWGTTNYALVITAANATRNVGISCLGDIVNNGFLNFTPDIKSLSNTQDQTISSKTSLLVLTPGGTNVGVKFLYKSINGANANPVDGDVLFIVNNATGYDIEFKTTGNILYKQSTFVLDEKDSCVFVYYGGKWRPPMDKGQ